MVYKLITPADNLAVSLTEAKAQLNIDPDFTGDDTLITLMIKAATLFVEKIIQGPVKEQVWLLQLVDFSDVVFIDKTPLKSIDTVKYYNDLNTESNVNSNGYEVDLSSVPARLIFKDSFNQPTVFDRFDAVNIEFTAGYETVPEDLALWIKILLTQFYEARDYSTVKPETDSMIRRNLMSYAAWI